MSSKWDRHRHHAVQRLHANETFDLSANGPRLRLFRDVGNIVMDINGVEQVNLTELRGADTTTVNDLSGTRVKNVQLNLAATPGGESDGAVDTVIVNGTSANNAVRISGATSAVSVDGLAAKVTITGGETTDNLVVHGRTGDDVLDSSAVGAGAIGLTLDGWRRQ
jgi:hypothetical protein